MVCDISSVLSVCDGFWSSSLTLMCFLLTQISLCCLVLFTFVLFFWLSFLLGCHSPLVFYMCPHRKEQIKVEAADVCVLYTLQMCTFICSQIIPDEGHVEEQLQGN